MTARSAAAVSSVLLACGLLVAGCTDYYEIPIETPIQPKMDVTGFQRVLVAGFIAGGTEDLDPNLETVRLLRSQLRTKSPLRVIEADVLPLAEIAADSTKEKDGGAASASGAAPGAAGLTPIASPAPSDGRPQANGKPTPTLESQIKTEKDFQKYDKI